MRHALYISEYNDVFAKRSKQAAHLGHQVDWSERLPAAWRHQVDGPLWVQVFRDQDCKAERWLGFNEDDEVCWVRYRYRVGSIDGEDLVAWLMRDGRWLIHRIIVRQGAVRSQSKRFFSLSERMPR